MDISVPLHHGVKGSSLSTIQPLSSTLHAYFIPLHQRSSRALRALAWRYVARRGNNVYITKDLKSEGGWTLSPFSTHQTRQEPLKRGWPIEHTPSKSGQTRKRW